MIRNEKNVQTYIDSKWGHISSRLQESLAEAFEDGVTYQSKSNEFLDILYALPFGKTHSFFGGQQVMRVPGGWIFRNITKGAGNTIISTDAVFVPYFEEKLNEKKQ